ncbi:MAG: F0F1 ATP synthase subunit beta, partial [Proteobacteria bacterium]
VGKTLLLTELIRNITGRHKVCGVFAGIGERIREGYEIWQDLQQSEVLKRTSLVFGCMSESPGARLRAGLTALTLAEYQQEISGEVLLFVDNVARFAQAGSEVSSLLGRMPGPMGCSPTLEIDIGEFEERIATTYSGTMTSIQTAYLPADDPSDPVVVATLPHMHAVAELSRSLCEQGIFPAVNPLAAASELLTPKIVGAEHFRVAQEVLRIMQRHQELQDLLAVLGVEELSPEDQVILTRARRLFRFLSQPLAVAEQLTGRKGVYVPIEDTVRSFGEIVDGVHDATPENELYMLGGIE